VETIVAEIRRRAAGRTTPFLVAIDGGCGSGKSTLAAMIVAEVNAALVTSDDFFAAHISDEGWDARTPAERAADAIDWRRLRAEVLEPLLAGERASWHAFDFESGTRPDGSYRMRSDVVSVEPAAVIVLDGAYASRPEFGDLVDLSVLVDVPVSERHRRIAARDDAEFVAGWHARWDAAEEYYFSAVRPAGSFDLVVST
jgi:para-aminobenzoate synthetase